MINPEISDSEVDQWVETRILTTCLLGIQSHNIGDEEASNELFAQAQLAAEEYNSQGALEFRESRLRLLGIALALRAEATVARLRTQTRAEMKLVFNDAERHIISEVDNVLAQAQSLFRESDSYTHLAWVSALWKQIFDQRAASEEQWPVLLASYAPRMSNRLEVDVASALSQAVASGEKFTEVSGRYFHTDLALTGPKAGPTAGYLDWKQAETQLGRPLRHPHQALDRTPSQFELAKRVAETAQALHKGDFTTAESLFGSVPYDVTRLGPGIVVASIADRIARPTYPTTRAHPLQETARALVAAMRPEIPVTGALNNPVRK
ncbi:MAG: hypothetical protein HOQ05_05780 [Corynebacteriales bacterium]|nr:hypothetical protein [Mycobacteriales bacterium]